MLGMASVTQEFLEFLDHQGWQGRIVGIDRLENLAHAIRSRHYSGQINSEFYEEMLTSFSFKPPESLPSAQSIIILAVPAPQTRVIFHVNGKVIPAVIPPTYAGYDITTDRVRTAVGVFLGPKGYEVAKTALPLKTLAVCSGLADYGKNNLCYVRGMGSFLQLVGCYSDLPCAQDTWREATVMERCESCVACQRKCPTGAIGSERFLLHAERCLTLHNEKPNDLPGWIDASAHNCLIGCMRCQSICPENKANRTWIEDRCEFSEEETALLLSGAPVEQLPTAMVQKLQSLALSEDIVSLPRNLSMLLSAPRRRLQ
jgi:epoxyqueuosine reductase